MIKIGLLSDTHSYIDERILHHLEDCDEIWHAGDVGVVQTYDLIAKSKPLRGVYGNIDDAIIKRILPKNQLFTVEGLKVFMTHIGGYPGRYTMGIKETLVKEKPQLFICGHSHILKVVRDPALKTLHINPGAAGVHGFHIMRTMVKFTIDKGVIGDLKVIELGKRNLITNKNLISI